MSLSQVQAHMHQKAVDLLTEDSDKILKLIEVQMDTLTNRRCPLYEEVLDTQMYGFSRMSWCARSRSNSILPSSA